MSLLRGGRRLNGCNAGTLARERSVPMVICLCKGVSDKKIRELIDQGAKSLKDIMASCRAGSDCGACVCHVKELLSATSTCCQSEQSDDAQMDLAAND